MEIHRALPRRPRQVGWYGKLLKKFHTARVWFHLYHLSFPLLSNVRKANQWKVSSQRRLILISMQRRQLCQCCDNPSLFSPVCSLGSRSHQRGCDGVYFRGFGEECGRFAGTFGGSPVNSSGYVTFPAALESPERKPSLLRNAPATHEDHHP